MAGSAVGTGALWWQKLPSEQWRWFPRPLDAVKELAINTGGKVTLSCTTVRVSATVTVTTATIIIIMLG